MNDTTGVTFHDLTTPPLKRGGSFFHCLLDIETEVPKLDKNGRKTRYTTKASKPCGYHVKINKPRRMIKHLAKVHGRL